MNFDYTSDIDSGDDNAALRRSTLQHCPHNCSRLILTLTEYSGGSALHYHLYIHTYNAYLAFL